MGIHEKETDTGLFQVGLGTGSVTAFGQPDAAWGPSQVALVEIGRHEDLRPGGLTVDHQGQESMGGTAGDDLQLAQILKFLEAPHQVVAIGVAKKVSGLAE